jgi:hypothetical protein
MVFLIDRVDDNLALFFVIFDGIEDVGLFFDFVSLFEGLEEVFEAGDADFRGF